MKIITFIDYASRVWLLDCSKLAVSWKKGNGVTIFWSDVIMNFFWSSISLVKCSHWYKFHVNIITSSGVMAISFYKRLTRKLEVKNTNVSRFCPKSGEWGELGLLNLTQASLIKRYWMLQKATVTAFTLSELLRENHKGMGIKICVKN